MSRGTWHILPSWAGFACVVFATLFIAGCGKSSPTEGDASTKQGGAASDEGRTTRGGDGSKSPSKDVSRDKEDGRRYVGDVPLDVWLEDPLAITKNNTPVGGAPAGTSPAGTPPAGTPSVASVPVKPEEKVAVATKVDSPPDKGAPAKAAAGDWKSLISGDVISDETKAIRAHISNSLQTVSKYNGNYKEIQVDAAVLAALAVAASDHPDSISWKKDARIVRDLAVEVGKQAKGLAKPNYDNTKVAFDRLDNFLSGNRPPDLAPPQEKVQLSEVAPRGPVMKRMDRAFNWLKTSVNSESILKSSADKAMHEAAIMTFLSKIVASPDYGSADEADYQKFLDTLVKSGQGVFAASKDPDFQAFSDALSKSQKTCNECHSSYRFSDG